MSVEKIGDLHGKDVRTRRIKMNVVGQLREVVPGRCLDKDAFIPSRKT